MNDLKKPDDIEDRQLRRRNCFSRSYEHPIFGKFTTIEEHFEINDVVQEIVVQEIKEQTHE
jgi:hypothetical protein